MKCWGGQNALMADDTCSFLLVKISCRLWSLQEWSIYLRSLFFPDNHIFKKDFKNVKSLLDKKEQGLSSSITNENDLYLTVHVLFTRSVRVNV